MTKSPQDILKTNRDLLFDVQKLGDVAILQPDYAFNYYNYNLEGEFYDDEGHLIHKINIIPKRENDRVFSSESYIIN